MALRYLAALSLVAPAAGIDWEFWKRGETKCSDVCHRVAAGGGKILGNDLGGKTGLCSTQQCGDDCPGRECFSNDDGVKDLKDYGMNCLKGKKVCCCDHEVGEDSATGSPGTLKIFEGQGCKEGTLQKQYALESVDFASSRCVPIAGHAPVEIRDQANLPRLVTAESDAFGERWCLRASSDGKELNMVDCKNDNETTPDLSTRWFKYGLSLLKVASNIDSCVSAIAGLGDLTATVETCLENIENMEVQRWEWVKGPEGYEGYYQIMNGGKCLEASSPPPDPTPAPTEAPTPVPTPQPPTPVPTTPVPTAVPTDVPTAEPTAEPTALPTPMPPTPAPTLAPTSAPTTATASPDARRLNYHNVDEVGPDARLVECDDTNRAQLWRFKGEHKGETGGITITCDNREEAENAPYVFKIHKQIGCGQGSKLVEKTNEEVSSMPLSVEAYENLTQGLCADISSRESVLGEFATTEASWPKCPEEDDKAFVNAGMKLSAALPLILSSAVALVFTA